MNPWLWEEWSRLNKTHLRSQKWAIFSRSYVGFYISFPKYFRDRRRWYSSMNFFVGLNSILKQTQMAKDFSIQMLENISNFPILKDFYIQVSEEKNPHDLLPA